MARSTRSIEYDNTAQLVVNTEDEPVVWEQEKNWEI